LPKKSARNTVKKKRGSSGGKAEATGSNYETLVGVWYCHCVLLGSHIEPPLDLPTDTRFRTAVMQSDAPVDDVNTYTDDGGIIFVQAKRTVSLSTNSQSPFGSAIDQFVRQYKECADKTGNRSWSRPLDESLDRLVLCTRSASSGNVTRTLSELLQRLRDRSDVRPLKAVATSAHERAVAKTMHRCVRATWRRTFGRAPTADELYRLLRLIWIQVLDLESGERDSRAVQTHFRAFILETPTQATRAFSVLFQLCARLRAQRSGTDRPALVRELTSQGIALTALPDYRADVRALAQWTANRVRRGDRFTQLLQSRPDLKIHRDLWSDFLGAATTSSFVVIGRPGAGKSGLMYRLAETASVQNYGVVLLPVDLLNADTFTTLQNELGIAHSLPDVLANWPGSKPGIVIIDALDAARKLETQAVLREIVGEILALRSRWTVVASVREYDIRQGTDWRSMFRGSPPIPAFASREFSAVQHVYVDALTDREIKQIATPFGALHQLFNGAPPKLRELLRNIFNLHLLAELLHDGATSESLAGVRSQPELLDSYWQRRIVGSDGRRDHREMTLETIVKKMTAAQSLQVPRSIRNEVDLDALRDLEQSDVLRSDDSEASGGEVLLFSHHVLFDYAAARLLFLRGRNADALIQLLKEQQTLTIMLGPSLTLALIDVWNTGPPRAGFWKLGFALSAATDLPGVSQLAAPMVVAEVTSDVDDLEPLIAALDAEDSPKTPAARFLEKLVGALFVRINGGMSLVGPDAGPWLELASRLADLPAKSPIRICRPIIARVTDSL
jgi:hypothetical protein